MAVGFVFCHKADLFATKRTFSMASSILPLSALSDETWLPVPGYDGLYEISNLGRARSWKSTRGNATLTDNQVREIRQMYAVPPVTFIALAKEYGVSSDTIQRAVRGKRPLLFTDEQIEEIRERWAGRRPTCKKIAGKFNANKDNIHAIVSGETWQHIT